MIKKEDENEEIPAERMCGTQRIKIGFGGSDHQKMPPKREKEKEKERSKKL